jgi:hypothetical protein
MKAKTLFKVFCVYMLVMVAGYAMAADTAVISPQDFLTMVLETIKGFGGVSWVVKVASVITLIVSSMKVSFLNELIWSKLGALQTWVAPLLGLVGGILALSVSGQLSLAGILAWLSAGTGAIALHELLDSVKSIPGLGAMYVGIIDMIEKLLGGPASQQDPKELPFKP